MMNTKKRFFLSSATNVNEEEFLDWNRPIVHVEGELTDNRLREIVCQPLSDIYLSVVQMKIEEMKDTAANRDVNSGGIGSGVTAAAAIAALQEAGNKVSRDMISASYRTDVSIAKLVVEDIRQFYDEARAFRIMAPNGTGDYSFVQLDNSRLKDQLIGTDAGGSPLYRRPVFDIKIKAQKKNPFSRMEQNEIAKELYSMGFFNPERAQEATIAIEMMDFEGIEQVRERISQGQTLLSVCQQLKQENDVLKSMLQAATGRPVTGGVTGSDQASGSSGSVPVQAGKSAGNGFANAVMQAQTPMTGYGQRLAKRSMPDINAGSNATAPGAM